MNTNTDQLVPSLDLYVNVHAGFVRQNTTLSQWCREQGVYRQDAHNALKGIWTSPKARPLIEWLVKASQSTW